MKRVLLVVLVLSCFLAACGTPNNPEATNTIPEVTITEEHPENQAVTEEPGPEITVDLLDYSQLPLFTPCTQDADGDTVETWKCNFQIRKDYYVGGWVNSYLALRNWNTYWDSIDPLSVMRENGFHWARTCVTTRSSNQLYETLPSNWASLPYDNFIGTREYSAQILREASKKGFHLNLCYYLSDQPTDGNTQSAPPEWQGLSLEETAAKIEEYTYETTMYFIGMGLNIELYDIGNEIEWGIVGFTPGDRVELPAGIDKTSDVDYLRHYVWDNEATLLKAAIAGIHRADPDAKTVLHISNLMAEHNTINGDFVDREFFSYMVSDGVNFDYAGLSAPYPTPGWLPGDKTSKWYFNRIQKMINHLEKLRKPMIISSGGYPSFNNNPDIHPITEYPFTPEGQAFWIREMLNFTSNNLSVVGFYSFPENFSGMPDEDVLLSSFGLFSKDFDFLPGLMEFRVSIP